MFLFAELPVPTHRFYLYLSQQHTFFIDVTDQNGGKIDDVIHQYIGKQARYDRCSADWKKARKEVKDLLNLFNKIKLQTDSIELAFRWFNKSYIEAYPDDALIDLMVAFEALIFEGEGSETKGRVIAIAVSMLIGKNEKERE